jgi:hypothetical protein
MHAFAWELIFNSSWEGKYQSEKLPVVKSEHTLAALLASAQPATISIVFWFPVPIAVPSAPGIVVPKHPHNLCPISDIVATNPLCALAS